MHDERMASDATEFWKQRHDITPFTDTDERVDGYRLVLLAEVTDPDVLSACERICDALDQFECFDPLPSSVLHITAKLFDTEVEPSTTGIENPSPAVNRVDRVVSNVVSRYEPFDVELPRLNLFPDVVYGEVADGGRLTGLNRRICDHGGIATLDRDDEKFIPHLTFGYFGNDRDFGALVEFLEANRELQLPTVPIEEVALVAYEVGGHPPTYNQLKRYEL